MTFRRKATETSPPTQALVYAAWCTGSMRLSSETGLPVVLVGATLDRDAALRRLNATGHGCAVRWPTGFQPLAFDPGWTDWSAFSLDAEHLRTDRLPDFTALVDGCIAVTLPAETTLADFASELAASLRHLRVQDAVIHPAFLEARTDVDVFATIVFHPRYTPRVPDEFRGATLVTDLYAFDPAADLSRLVWLVASARLGACQGGRGP